VIIELLNSPGPAFTRRSHRKFPIPKFFEAPLRQSALAANACAAASNARALEATARTLVANALRGASRNSLFVEEFSFVTRVKVGPEHERGVGYLKKFRRKYCVTKLNGTVTVKTPQDLLCMAGGDPLKGSYHYYLVVVPYQIIIE
jgi:hypothetical protein